MKKLLIILVLLLSACVSAPKTVVVDEKFDGNSGLDWQLFDDRIALTEIKDGALILTPREIYDEEKGYFAGTCTVLPIKTDFDLDFEMELELYISKLMTDTHKKPEFQILLHNDNVDGMIITIDSEFCTIQTAGYYDKLSHIISIAEKQSVILGLKRIDNKCILTLNNKKVAKFPVSRIGNQLTVVCHNMQLHIKSLTIKQDVVDD